MVCLLIHPKNSLLYPKRCILQHFQRSRFQMGQRCDSSRIRTKHSLSVNIFSSRGSHLIFLPQTRLFDLLEQSGDENDLAIKLRLISQLKVVCAKLSLSIVLSCKTQELPLRMQWFLEDHLRVFFLPRMGPIDLLTQPRRCYCLNCPIEICKRLLQYPRAKFVSVILSFWKFSKQELLHQHCQDW